MAEAAAGISLLTGASHLPALTHFLDTRAKAIASSLSPTSTTSAHADVAAQLSSVLTLLRTTAVQAWRVFLSPAAAGLLTSESGTGTAATDVWSLLAGCPAAVSAFVATVLPTPAPGYLPQFADTGKWTVLLTQAMAYNEPWLSGVLTRASAGVPAVATATATAASTATDDAAVRSRCADWVRQQCGLIGSRLHDMLIGVASPRELVAIRRTVREVCSSSDGGSRSSNSASGGSSGSSSSSSHSSSTSSSAGGGSQANGGDTGTDAFQSAYKAFAGPRGPGLDLWAEVLQSEFAARASELLVSFFTVRCCPEASRSRVLPANHVAIALELCHPNLCACGPTVVVCVWPDCCVLPSRRPCHASRRRQRDRWSR